MITSNVLLNRHDIPTSHEFMTLTLDVFTFFFFVLCLLGVVNKTVHRETAANSNPFAVPYISEEEIQTLFTLPSYEISPEDIIFYIIF